MKTLTESQIATIKRAFNYRKKTVRVEPYREGMSLNSYWSGGSRDYYSYVTLDGKIVETIPQNGTPFDRLNLKTEGPLAEGVVLVQSGIFNGKSSTMVIYC